ncbi:MAG: hypothetical protein HY050_07030 [Actinobacteria bacterium]|nr:hypothetical protein [Actinomycetota bacterium]
MLSGLLISVLSPTAQAAEKGYRYWGYFQAAPGTSTWTMASTGPSTVVPDGSVEGWVFTFSSDSIPDAAQPMISPKFSRLCGKTKFAPTTQKRVGVIVDFGKTVLRPKGETIPHFVSKCVVVEKSAIGSDILAKVTKIRMAASGFVCGLNNYPAKECGAEVTTPPSMIVKK